MRLIVYVKEISEEIAILHDNADFSVGPVTIDDHERKQITNDWSFYELEILKNQSGKQIGMKETAREANYSMRINYNSLNLKKLECQINSQFKVNYKIN
jgi:hypothetical protein